MNDKIEILGHFGVENVMVCTTHCIEAKFDEKRMIKVEILGQFSTLYL